MKEREINFVEYQYDRLNRVRKGTKHIDIARMMCEDDLDEDQLPAAGTKFVADGKGGFTPAPASQTPPAAPTGQAPQGQGAPQTAPVAVAAGTGINTQGQAKRSEAQVKADKDKRNHEKALKYYRDHVTTSLANLDIGSHERETFIAGLHAHEAHFPGLISIIRREEVRSANSNPTIKKKLMAAMKDNPEVMKYLKHYGLQEAVEGKFDKYLHMIKTSPTNALDFITRQDDLNEFVEYMDTLNQDMIDEMIVNRQNYYLFKSNLAHKMGVMKMMVEKENPWTKIYMK